MASSGLISRLPGYQPIGGSTPNAEAIDISRLCQPALAGESGGLNPGTSAVPLAPLKYRIRRLHIRCVRDRAACHGCTGSGDGASDVGPPGAILGGVLFFQLVLWGSRSEVPAGPRRFLRPP